MYNSYPGTSEEMETGSQSFSDEVEPKLVRISMITSGHETENSLTEIGDPMDDDIPPPAYSESDPNIEHRRMDIEHDTDDNNIPLRITSAQENIPTPTQITEMCLETRAMAQNTQGVVVPAIQQLEHQVDSLEQKTQALERVGETIGRVVPLLDEQMHHVEQETHQVTTQAQQAWNYLEAQLLG